MDRAPVSVHGAPSVERWPPSGMQPPPVERRRPWTGSGVPCGGNGAVAGTWLTSDGGIGSWTGRGEGLLPAGGPGVICLAGSTFRPSDLPTFRPCFRASPPPPTSVTPTASPSTCPSNIAARPSPGADVRAVFSISGAHHGRRRPQRPQEVLDREQPEPAHRAAGPARR